MVGYQYSKLLLLCSAFFLLQFSQSCQKTVREDGTTFPFQEAVRVGPSNHHSCFSYYNTTPESPDGSLIAYVKLLSMPQEERYEEVNGEIWICNSDLSNQRKVVDVSLNGVHNGARLQWLDNRSFAYQDDMIRAVTIEGKELIAPVAGTIGHKPFQGRFLYASVDDSTGLYTIFEYDVLNQKISRLGDASNYTQIEELFPFDDMRLVEDRRILHLQYSPDGTKIAFRIDIGSKDEQFKHLISQNIDGSDIRFFGSKPMHFAWYDNASLMGHDNQINDGMPNDKSGRRWDLNGNHIETLSGMGNHLAASYDRELFASESWYKENPIVLRVFKKGEMLPIWQDTVSIDSRTTWTLANHVNPSFSRDNRRLYFNKYTEEGLAQAHMVVLSK
ncbi:MAG: hypothetical protein RIF33_00180 [Cyclobacteriaceae bacterium]